MKDKTTAGLLAIFGGVFGIHRFYLGQTALGILYILLSITSLSAILGLIDGIIFLAQDEKRFDYKYNKHRYQYQGRQADVRQRPQRRSNAPVKKRTTQSPAPRRSTTSKKNPFFETGMKKYEDYDMSGAIADFNKALEISPQHVHTHFRLACAYSLMENKKKGFYHLSKAVENGMTKLDKIKSTDELAFLRIQDEYEDFEKNNFRLAPSVQPPADIKGLDEDILLRQLNKLKDLRDRGILTEAEFVQEKRKLSR